MAEIFTGRDNASAELIECVRANDAERFRALASCLMSPDTIEEYWRALSGHPGSPCQHGHRADPSPRQGGETRYPDPICVCGAIMLEWYP